MSDSSWLIEFPEMGKDSLREFKRAVDIGYRGFSRTYGEAIEGFFEPLLTFLVWFERFEPIALLSSRRRVFVGARQSVGEPWCFVEAH